MKKRAHVAPQGLLVHLVQPLQPVFDLVRDLVDLVDVVLHLLADALHLLRARHRLAALVRLLQGGLVAADGGQDALRGHAGSGRGIAWSVDQY